MWRVWWHELLVTCMWWHELLVVITAQQEAKHLEAVCYHLMMWPWSVSLASAILLSWHFTWVVVDRCFRLFLFFSCVLCFQFIAFALANLMNRQTNLKVCVGEQSRIQWVVKCKCVTLLFQQHEWPLSVKEVAVFADLQIWLRISKPNTAGLQTSWGTLPYFHMKGNTHTPHLMQLRQSKKWPCLFLH